MYKNKHYQKTFEEFETLILNNTKDSKDFLDEINNEDYYPLTDDNFSNDISEISEHLWFKIEEDEDNNKIIKLSYIDYTIITLARDFWDFIADYIAFYSTSKQLIDKRNEFIFCYWLYHELWIDFVIVINDFKVYLMFWDDFIINQIKWNFTHWVSYIKFSDYQKKYYNEELKHKEEISNKIFKKENADFFSDFIKYDFEKISIELHKWKIKFLEWEEILKPLDKWKEMEQEEWFDYWDIRKIKHEWRYVWIKREIKKKYK